MDYGKGRRRQKAELTWNGFGEVDLPGDNQAVERQRKSRGAWLFSHAPLRQSNAFLRWARLFDSLSSAILDLSHGSPFTAPARVSARPCPAFLA